MQSRKSFLIALAALGLATAASAQAVKPISQLPSATVPLGTAWVPVLQGGATKQAPAAALGIPVAGSVAPTPIATYQLWWDTSATPANWRVYDGTSWVQLGTLDPSAHVFTAPNALSPTVTIPQPSGTAQTSSNINSLGASGTGTIAIANATGWPGSGYLRTADNGEYLAYTRNSGNNLTITARGTCGTGAAAIAHSNGVSVVWMALILCPSGGSTPPLLALDGSGVQYLNGSSVLPIASIPLGVGLQANGSVFDALTGDQRLYAGGATNNLANSDCGSRIQAYASGDEVITFPASPPASCKFTAEMPLAGNLLVDTQGVGLNMPGYGNHPVDVIPLPLTNNKKGTISWSYDGTNWDTGAHSSAWYEAAAPLDSPVLSHGQFRMYVSGATVYLCPVRGAGGIIIDGQMHRILAACWTYPVASLTPGTTNYIYAAQLGSTQVQGTSNGGPGTSVRLQVATVFGTGLIAGQQLGAACHSIRGTTEADGFYRALYVDSTHFDLPDVPYAHAFSAAGNAACRFEYIIPSTTTHTTSSPYMNVPALETKTGNTAQTYTGYIVTNGGGAVTSTQSWMHSEYDFTGVMGSNADGTFYNAASTGLSDSSTLARHSENLSVFAVTSSAQMRGLLSDESGTGAALFANGALGDATATTLNKLTLTPPATGSTFTLIDGKTLTVNNTLTLSATDGSTLAIGTGGTLGTNAYTSTAYAPLANPTFSGTMTWPDGTACTGIGCTLGQTFGLNGKALTGGANITASSAGGYQIVGGATSGTVPSFAPNKASATSGIGASASGAVDIIAAGTDVFRIGTGSHAYAIAFATAAATQTGYLCYNSGSTPANELLLDTTACLVSLEELKDIRAPITPDDALADVMQLRPFWYKWNQARHPTTDRREQPGLGAHAVERVDARLVTYDAHGHLKGVRYEQMTAVLIAAVQKLARHQGFASTDDHSSLWFAIWFLGAWNVVLTIVIVRRNRR
jgi:hypothetical protein